MTCSLISTLSEAGRRFFTPPRVNTELYSVSILLLFFFFYTGYNADDIITEVYKTTFYS